MGKEIHFYESACQGAAHDWNAARERIERGHSRIRTTQMGLLGTELFELGYRIIIHEGDGECYEIKLGTGNARTGREIRMGHNLFKMWQAGEFAKDK